MAEFEKRRETERKRTEEEKRRSRRDRMLLEKAARDKKGVEEKKATEEIEELHNKVRVILLFILWNVWGNRGPSSHRSGCRAVLTKT